MNTKPKVKKLKQNCIFFIIKRNQFVSLSLTGNLKNLVDITFQELKKTINLYNFCFWKMKIFFYFLFHFATIIINKDVIFGFPVNNFAAQSKMFIPSICFFLIHYSLNNLVFNNNIIRKQSRALKAYFSKLFKNTYSRLVPFKSISGQFTSVDFRFGLM